MANSKFNGCNTFNGKLHDHFGFNLTLTIKLLMMRSYTVFTVKVFVFCGSNTSTTYHLQHKHPVKYNTLLSKSVVRQASLSQFLLGHKEPVSVKLQTDITNSIGHWIVSGGRPISLGWSELYIKISFFLKIFNSISEKVAFWS